MGSCSFLSINRTVLTTLLLLASLALSSSIAQAQTPEFIWANRAGGSTSFDQGYGIAIDGSGNLLATGRFGGTSDFNGLTVTAVGTGSSGPVGFYIAKYSNDGNLIWLRHNGGSPTSGSNFGFGVTTDNSDNVIAVGAYEGSISFGAITLPFSPLHSPYMYLLKYDSSGNLLWARAATGPYVIHGRDVATDDTGNIYVTGVFGHHNFGGSVTFGSITLTSVGGHDIFIAKYDPNGNVL